MPRSFSPRPSSCRPGSTMTSVRSGEGCGARQDLGRDRHARVADRQRRRRAPSPARRIRMRLMSDVPQFAFSHMGMFVTDARADGGFLHTRARFCRHGSRAKCSVLPSSCSSAATRTSTTRSSWPAAGPQGGGFNPINQISFRMADFAGLREMHRRLEKEGVKRARAGVARQRAVGVLPRSRGQPHRAVRRHAVVRAAAGAHADGHEAVRRRAVEVGRGARRASIPDFKPVEQWRAGA